MDAGHSVDSVRSHNAQVRHVDFLAVHFLDQGHPPQAVQVSRVKLANTLKGEERDVSADVQVMHV